MIKHSCSSVYRHLRFGDDVSMNWIQLLKNPAECRIRLDKPNSGFPHTKHREWQAHPVTLCALTVRKIEPAREHLLRTIRFSSYFRKWELIPDL